MMTSKHVTAQVVALLFAATPALSETILLSGNIIEIDQIGIAAPDSPTCVGACGTFSLIVSNSGVQSDTFGDVGGVGAIVLQPTYGALDLTWTYRNLVLDYGGVNSGFWQEWQPGGPDWWDDAWTGHRYSIVVTSFAEYTAPILSPPTFTGGIPESGTWAMMIAGAAALAFAYGRRSRIMLN